MLVATERLLLQFGFHKLIYMLNQTIKFVINISTNRMINHIPSILAKCGLCTHIVFLPQFEEGRRPQFFYLGDSALLVYGEV